mmetsp:Transcript_102355/g.272375  ORF Transcript_102355/g.272375 Transcript_102355/m.272375 type:complete len:313 (-) Transcript_102355:287-1225(-)
MSAASGAALSHGTKKAAVAPAAAAAHEEEARERQQAEARRARDGQSHGLRVAPGVRDSTSLVLQQTRPSFRELAGEVRLGLACAADAVEGATPYPPPRAPLRRRALRALLRVRRGLRLTAALSLVRAAPQALLFCPRPLVVREVGRAVKLRRFGLRRGWAAHAATPHRLAAIAGLLDGPQGVPVLEANRAVKGRGGRAHGAPAPAGGVGGRTGGRGATEVVVVAAPRLLGRRPHLLPPVRVLLAVVRRHRRGGDRSALHANGAYAGHGLEHPALAALELQVEHAVMALHASHDSEEVAGAQHVLGLWCIDLG